MKVKEYLHHIFSGGKGKFVLVNREEHEQLHQKVKCRYCGAKITVNTPNGICIRCYGSDAYPHIAMSQDFNWGVRCLAWQRRGEIWNQPEVVQFT